MNSDVTDQSTQESVNDAKHFSAAMAYRAECESAIDDGRAEMI